jgi:hypothetical protein
MGEGRTSKNAESQRRAFAMLGVRPRPHEPIAAPKIIVLTGFETTPQTPKRFAAKN